MNSAWMEAAEKIEREMQFLREENARKDRVIAEQNNLLASHENVIDSMTRSARLDAQRYEDLENRNRQLERSNAVLHSRYDDIRVLMNMNEEEMAVSSKGLTPDMIFAPRRAEDDAVSVGERNLTSKAAEKAIERLMGGNDYVSETARRSGLADAASEHAEALKPTAV